MAVDKHAVEKAVRQAEEAGELLESVVLSGYSGGKLVGALQRIAALFAGDPTACYVEVGVFQGLTLLSVAASNPTVPCYGIDNFAYFDTEKKNLKTVEERREKLGALNANIINQDYEDALESLKEHLGDRKVALYFVDGPHDYRSQLMCLELITPHLHEHAVIVVDDSNYAHVRQANRDFLVTHSDMKLVFEAYTRTHPNNMTEAELADAKAGWWNGVNILMRRPAESVISPVPPTIRDRTLYENEHLIHPSSSAELAPTAIALMDAIGRGSYLRAAKILFVLVRAAHRSRSLISARYPSMNTYSHELSSRKYHF